MTPYKNLRGDSGVRGYEVSFDSITVGFQDGSKYKYTYQSAGRSNVEHMKQLAGRGWGLNTFINTNVRKAYAARWR